MRPVCCVGRSMCAHVAVGGGFVRTLHVVASLNLDKQTCLCDLPGKAGDF